MVRPTPCNRTERPDIVVPRASRFGAEWPDLLRPGTSTLTGNLSAYDHYLRAIPYVHRGTREAIDEALPLFHKSIAVDPEFAYAHAMAAWCHCERKING